MSFGSWISNPDNLGPVLAPWLYDALKPKPAKAADIGAPPELPSLTDQAIQIARDREARRNRAGGTTSTFLTGQLGALEQPSSFVQSMLGS